MSRFFFSPIFLLCLIALTLPTRAQTPPQKQPLPAGDAARQAEAKAEADRVAKQRRGQARSLLLSLASDARSFHDQTLRARTLARIADALWDTDVERGRELFRKAWEAAGSADQETIRKRQEDIRRQQARSGGGYAIPSYPNVRCDVLRLAARHDRKLGEEFLQSLNGDQQQDVNGEEQRLTLARELLATGDPECALQFASSELSTINVFTVDFLSWLREKNAAGADQRYATMVDTAARSALSGANTVSLLSSYLFTPHVYVSFHGSGLSYAMMGSGPPPADVPPALQMNFFQMAAGVLLRPDPQLQAEQQTAGIEGTYLVMKRLLPRFEQYAPQEMTDALQARFEALGAMVRDSVRRRNIDPTQESPSESATADREQAILDKIDHAKTSAERDQLYFQLAEEAVRKDSLHGAISSARLRRANFGNRRKRTLMLCWPLIRSREKRSNSGWS